MSSTRPLALVLGAVIWSAAPSVQAQILVSSFFDDSVLLYDLDGNLLGPFTKGVAPIGPEGLAFAPNGNLLVVSRKLNSVFEYDRVTGRYAGTFTNEGLSSPHGMTRDDDGNYLVGSIGAVKKYGPSGEPLGAFANIQGALIGLEYGPNGNLFVSAGALDAVVEVDSTTGQVLGDFAIGDELYSPNQIVFAGDRLFVGGDDPTGILAYDAFSGDFIEIFASGFGMSYPGPLLLHPNGNLLVATGYGDSILEFDLETGDFVNTFTTGVGFATFATILPPGCLTIVTEQTTCHADGSTFTYSAEGLNGCTGSMTQVTFTGSGGAAGEEMCFTALVNDGGFCCSSEICVTIPDCSAAAPPGDLDGDGLVGILDFIALLGAWGPCDDCSACPANFDGDCSVGLTDVLELLANWG